MTACVPGGSVEDGLGRDIINWESYPLVAREVEVSGRDDMEVTWEAHPKCHPG